MDAYEKLAAFYDEFQDAEERDELLQIIIENIKQYFPDQPFRKLHLADLGCGTGVFTLPFLQQGFVVSGIDLAETMISVLSHKLTAAPPAIRDRLMLKVADLINYSLPHKANIITALTDTLNHISPCELPKALLTAHQNLVDNGLLIFDLLTRDFLREERGDLTFYAEISAGQETGESEEDPQSSMIWENCWLEDEEKAISDFTFYEKQENGLYRRLTGQVTEYYHNEQTVLEATKTIYDCLKIIQFPERILYIFRKH